MIQRIHMPDPEARPRIEAYHVHRAGDQLLVSRPSGAPNNDEIDYRWLSRRQLADLVFRLTLTAPELDDLQRAYVEDRDAGDKIDSLEIHPDDRPRAPDWVSDLDMPRVHPDDRPEAPEWVGDT